jgi:(p)ppGpp synthase/HD superfamily hydrolase
LKFVKKSATAGRKRVSSHPRRHREKPALTGRFIRALGYAARVHSRQVRKGKGRPYVGHLLSVASIVIEHGGDEDAVIAALLHDAVEDQGGLPRLREIRNKFGARVARIVEGCTDSHEIPKPPWRERKLAYISRVRSESPEVRLVSAADKLSNAREILADHRLEGDAVFERFHGRKDGTLEYYRALVNEFRAAGTSPLVEELDRVVTALEARARAANDRTPSAGDRMLS